MIDNNKRTEQEQRKEQYRRRFHVDIDPEKYEYIPAKKPIDYYDEDTHVRVAVYVRVSTDNIEQTSSFELQKKYYEDLIKKRENWTFVKIYADEGISGTSTKRREQFLKMIEDAKKGMFDMIITKSVSRLARNVGDFIGTIRDLTYMKPPVGIFFESENIFSLNEDSELALTFTATMAQEESHIKSRSMETSLRMRLDNGIPLTPKLLGYTHDANGKLIINEKESPTVKLAFFMYLYGYSSSQIAKAFNALERKSYLGNVKWTSGAIIQILRNERHCGEVLTRKRFKINYKETRTSKNYGERPQSRYIDHHEAIVSRDDFIAVQKLIDNAKFKNKNILPELRVIETGILKGFVTINPRWAGFKELDYMKASLSVYNDEEKTVFTEPEEKIEISVEAGDFDLRNFEIVRSEFFDSYYKPFVSMGENKIKFGTACVRKFGKDGYVELLVHPYEKKFAVRSSNKENRNAVHITKMMDGIAHPKDVSAAAFMNTLYSLFEWNDSCRYRMLGSIIENEAEKVIIFDANDSAVYIKPFLIDTSNDETEETERYFRPLTKSGKRIKAVPQEWTKSFGREYYFDQHDAKSLSEQSKDEWKLRLQGQLFKTGKELKVTSFEEIKSYITQELDGINIEEDL